MYFIAAICLYFQCLPLKTILLLEDIQKPENLTKAMFRQLCPVIIYQLDTDACHVHHKDGHLRIPVTSDQKQAAHEVHDHDHPESEADLSNHTAKGKELN